MEMVFSVFLTDCRQLYIGTCEKRIMPPQKYRAKGKFEAVSEVQFTLNSHSPYQTFKLIESPNEFNYFGNYDLAGIPYGTDMEFQYEKRGKFLNVRELPGFEQLSKLDLKSLKEDYEKTLGSQSERADEPAQTTGESSQNQVDHNRIQTSLNQTISLEMELKAHMNAGNTSRDILELAYSAAAKNEDGSMNQESFEIYHTLLLNKLEQGYRTIISTLKGELSDEDY